jgi:glutamate-1-semialdehyde aminotransferase
MEGMAPYLGDQVASSRQSQLYGEIADKAAQAAAAVEQANAGEATKTNATNLGVRLQGAQAQAAADSEYNTNVIGSKAIFDKNLQLKNVNIYANTVATLDNMARTDAANYVFGDEFNINGMNPFNPIQQIRGKSPNGQVSGDPGGSLMAAYQAALKNPDFAGMDKEDIKDLVIAEYNKSAYANAASTRKKTLANSIMGAYMSPVAANNPMMSSLSAYTQGMNPYTNAANDQAF